MCIRDSNKGSLKLLFKRAEDRAKWLRKMDAETAQMERQASRLSEADECEVGGWWRWPLEHHCLVLA